MTFYEQYYKIRAQYATDTGKCIECGAAVRYLPENEWSCTFCDCGGAVSTLAPSAVAIMKIGDYYEAFDGDAKIIARACGLNVLSRRLGRHGTIDMTGFLALNLDKCTRLLCDAGFRVIAIERIDPYQFEGRMHVAGNMNV